MKGLTRRRAPEAQAAAPKAARKPLPHAGQLWIELPATAAALRALLCASHLAGCLSLAHLVKQRGGAGGVLWRQQEACAPSSTASTWYLGASGQRCSQQGPTQDLHLWPLPAAPTAARTSARRCAFCAAASLTHCASEETCGGRAGPRTRGNALCVLRRPVCRARHENLKRGPKSKTCLATVFMALKEVQGTEEGEGSLGGRGKKLKLMSLWACHSQRCLPNRARAPKPAQGRKCPTSETVKSSRAKSSPLSKTRARKASPRTWAPGEEGGGGQQGRGLCG